MIRAAKPILVVHTSHSLPVSVHRISLLNSRIVILTVTPLVLTVQFCLGVGGVRTMLAYNPGTRRYENLPLTVEMVRNCLVRQFK